MIPTILVGQKSIFQAHIIDSSTKKPLPYCNIVIIGENKGTVSNEQGFFSLKSESDKFVSISQLGYKTKKIKLSSINQEIKLNPISQTIDEILIIKSRLLKSPIKILDRCIDNMQKYKPPKNYLSSAFLRQTHQSKNCFVKIIEADLNTICIPQSNTWNVNVNHKRQSDDYRIIKSNDLFVTYNYSSKTMNIRHAIKQSKYYTPSRSELNSLIRKADQHFNPITKDLSLCSFAYNSKNKGKFNLQKLKKEQTLKIDSIIISDNESFYKIKILPSKKELKKYPFVTIGYITISTEDFSIKEVEIARIKNPRDTKQLASLITGNGIKYRFNIRYKKYKNSIYPTYIFSNSKDRLCYDNPFKSNNFTYISRQIVFNKHIETNNKITSTSHWHNNLYEEYDYDDNFWKNFPEINAKKQSTILESIIK